YEACDGGGLCSGAATVTISVDSVNDAPVIEDQPNPIGTPEETAVEIVLADFTVTDADSDPSSFVLSVQDGANYTRVGNTITPLLDFNGDLTVPVTVSDGEDVSEPFGATVSVTPVNDAPTITGQAPLVTPEDTSLVVALTDLTVADPDSVFPDEFELLLQDGTNYTRTGNTITPAQDFNGTLSVGATVSDGFLSSEVRFLAIEVTAENDEPVLIDPIDAPVAIEGSLYTLAVAANFEDADGDTLTFAATGLPASGSIAFDTVTGTFSGTPTQADARDDDPYVIVVTASDNQPGSAPAQAQFDLNISALDRANVSLEITAAPDPAMTGDQLNWTMTAANPQGPQGATDVEITGAFVGRGLTITPDAGCTMQPEVDGKRDFDCSVGVLPVGESVAVSFTITTSVPGDVVAYGTASNADPVPLDPNTDDNSAQKAVGVAEAYSNGVVQVLGTSGVLSVAAGDVNGDGAADLVAGTAAGQPLQVYLSDGFRDFADAPIAIAENGAHTGVALADFDNNDTLDIVVSTGGAQTGHVFVNDGIGNFSLLTDLNAPFAQDVAVGDFDADGNADIAFATIEGNPVYLGNGAGQFVLDDTLGSANSNAVAVARLNGDNRDDLVFANGGSDSQVWIRNAGAGFSQGASLPVGDAAGVAVGDFDGVGGPDLAFARIPSDADDVAANPVLYNDGSGGFPAATNVLLGTSATTDIHAGDVNRDGLPDLVFVNASGVHQVWTGTGSGFDLWREQIVDDGSSTGVLAELGMADAGEPGGVDLAMGGAAASGLGVFLNDGFGNLGMGDAVPPELTLVGEAAVDVASGSAYSDAGATALDNIDGDISGAIVVSSNVNTAVVGNYTVTYNVTDRAGNEATPISRTVRVNPAAGTGGGGGGALGFALLAMMLASGIRAAGAGRAIIRNRNRRRGSGNV
ncbi:MAG: FG-GAP-like repeat-containing protein, partial [Proteobacteria bacterium]|nr:FG-GAP-like repeat-containing protein [Pseudomonadota bacterium]